MEKELNSIQQDITLINEVEYENLKLLMKEAQEEVLDTETIATIDAFNSLYLIASEIPEEEYRRRFAELSNQYPDFGKADINNYRNSLREAKRLAEALEKLKPLSAIGKELLAVKIKIQQQEMEIYTLLLESPLSAEAEAQIKKLEQDNFESSNYSNQIIEKYEL